MNFLSTLTLQIIFSILNILRFLLVVDTQSCPLPISPTELTSRLNFLLCPQKTECNPKASSHSIALQTQNCFLHQSHILP